MDNSRQGLWGAVPELLDSNCTQPYDCDSMFDYQAMCALTSVTQPWWIQYEAVDGADLANAFITIMTKYRLDR